MITKARAAQPDLAEVSQSCSLAQSVPSPGWVEHAFLRPRDTRTALLTPVQCQVVFGPREPHYSCTSQLAYACTDSIDCTPPYNCPTIDAWYAQVAPIIRTCPWDCAHLKAFNYGISTVQYYSKAIWTERFILSIGPTAMYRMLGTLGPPFTRPSRHSPCMTRA